MKKSLVVSGLVAAMLLAGCQSVNTTSGGAVGVERKQYMFSMLSSQEVDQMYNALFREFLTFMMEDPLNITPCMHLHFMAKNIERMGDLVTTIAEQVIYLVTGELPADERAKADVTSVAKGAGG